MGCCQADAASSSSSWTLSRHGSFLFVQRLQTAFHDRGGSVEGEVTWKYLGAAVLRRGAALGTLRSGPLHHKCIFLCVPRL